MPQKQKKTNSFYLPILISVGLILMALVFLTLGSTGLDLAESRIIFASNLSQKSPQPQTSVSPPPVLKIVDKKIPPPTFSGKSVLAIDLTTDEILYQKNIHDRLHPASTTKIVTALVGSEHFKSGDSLVVTSDAMVGGSSMDLVAGETMSFRSLLYGMLLNSGNDAAFTIALNYPGGLSAFIDAMNKKALDLGLSDTNFQNPAGFDGNLHYSSAYDLSVFAKEAIKNPVLAKVFNTKETYVSSLDKSKVHNLKNLNQLLGEDGVVGIKTGFTNLAGENLVGLVERDNRKILTVVLNSNDRFGETKALIDWVFTNFSFE